MTPTDPDAPPPAPQVSRRDGGRVGAWLLAITVILFAGLLGGTVLGRVVRAPPAPLAVVVTFLPYLYALLAAWVFGLWCAVPDRGVLPALLAAVLGVAGALWGPSWSARSDPAPGDDLTMLSWNLRRLWGGDDDGGDPLACAVSAIRGADPDVLTLTEVSRADVDALSARLGLSCFHTDYLGSGEATRGGLAVCTRGDRWRLASGDAWRFTDGDDWRYVHGDVHGPGGRVINVVGVHLHPYWPLTRRDVREGVIGLAKGEPLPLMEVGRTGEEVVRIQGAQSAALLDRVERFHDPTLVGGDFNSTRDGALHTALRRTFVDVWAEGGRGFGGTVTVFGRIPLRIDFVYATPTFAVRDAAVLGAACSDHRAVLGHLALRAP